MLLVAEPNVYVSPKREVGFSNRVTATRARFHLNSPGVWLQNPTPAWLTIENGFSNPAQYIRGHFLLATPSRFDAKPGE